MKIGTKLFLYHLIPLIALMTLFAYLEQRRARTVLSEEVAREGRVLTRTIQIAVQDAVRDRQLEDVHTLVDRISGSGPVMGVRLFDSSGSLTYQSANLEHRPFAESDALRTTLLQGRSVETHARVDAKPVASFLVPLFGNSGVVVGAIQVLQHEGVIRAEESASRRAIVALTAVMILATGIVVLLVTRISLTKPVEDLVRSFRDVSSGDLSTQIPITRRDEFGRLAREFNRMCGRLDVAQRSLLEGQEERRNMEARLRLAEHRAGLGRLAAGLAHEIGTPLNVIAGRAESLSRRLSGDEVAEAGLRIVSAQIDRIARIVRGMLDFAREPEPRLHPTDVAAVVSKVLEFLEPQFEEAGIRVAGPDCRDLLPISADSDQLYQVFLNIALNAADAMPSGGVFRVGAHYEDRSHPERGNGIRPYLAVTFEDSGHGIAARDLDRVFEPFFTTKEIGRGTGLGMSISYGIVREHGGWIELDSEPRRRTLVTVYLPAAESAAVAAAAAS